MTDQELIQAIKHWRKDFYLKADHVGHGILLDTIIGRYIALQTENGSKDREIERLKKDAEGMRANWYKCSNNYREKCHAIKVLESALSRVEAERDAAIADISHVCPTCGQFQGGDCPVLFYKDYPKDCEHWRWRGVQGEG